MEKRFTSVSIKTEVISQIRQHQIRTLRAAMADTVEFPPSLSKWIEKAIEQRLEREGVVATSEGGHA
jgi:hypothetical protein